MREQKNISIGLLITTIIITGFGMIIIMDIKAIGKSITFVL